MAHRQPLSSAGGPVYAQPPPQVRVKAKARASLPVVPPPVHSPTMPQVPAIPDVPKAISYLLDATRRLEESIRKWGNMELSETDVSDVFVDVGNAFHEMLAAFSVYGIDMSEVSNFLNELRALLEECLSEDPTPQNLDRLVPQVRQVIARLLIGLRDKQKPYWQAVRTRNSGGNSRSSSGSGYR